MALVYFFVALLATLLGAMTGLGGGVIIKPALDALGPYGADTVSVLSAATVFSMSVVSLLRQIRMGFRVERHMCLIAAGSVLGGWLGKLAFGLAAGAVQSDVLMIVQSAMLGGVLCLVLCRDRLRPLRPLQNPALFLAAGAGLGMLAVFLGIGGGPINVAALCLLLGLSSRDAAVVSVLIIFFSQGSKLVLTGLDPGFGAYELSMLRFMIPAAVLGGFLGAGLNRRLSAGAVERVFRIAMWGVIALTAYNLVCAALRLAG